MLTQVYSIFRWMQTAAQAVRGGLSTAALVHVKQGLYIKSLLMFLKDMSH